MEKKIQQTIIDPADKERSFAAQLSLVVGLALLVVKFWAWGMTHSQAVLSDALESIINVVGAGLLIFVIYYGSQPADEDHPYGHGKIEYFSSAFEGGLITFAAILIMIEASTALIIQKPLHELNFGLYVVIGAGVVNLALGLYLIHKGKTKKSIALKASGKHIITDFWTSVGVAIGLVLVKFTGLIWIDSVTAIVVAVLILKAGLGLFMDAFDGLMDKENPEDIERLSKIFSENMTHLVIQIHHLKVIRSGRYHHIDAHLVVPEYWNVKDIHENILLFEKRVIAAYGYAGEIHFHLDPCRKVYCKFCDVEDCSIRKEQFEKRMPVVIDDLKHIEEPEEFIKGHAPSEQ